MTDLTRLPQQALDSILLAGIRAPSADNAHLFRYTVLPDRLVVSVSEDYVTATAQTRLLAWISFGAVVENILIQASQFGLQGAPSWFRQERVACEILFGQVSSAADPLVDAIPARCTNRRLHFGRKLAPPTLAELDAQVNRVSGVRLLWLDAPDARRRALRLTRLAETERFRVPALHEELFSSLRFDVGTRESCEHGIPIGAAEIEPPARPFFRLMRKWPVMRLLNRVGTYRFVGWRAGYLPARLAPHLGVLAADGGIQNAAVHVGRALERLWLRATQLDLALQPMAAAPLYARPEAATVTPEIREALVDGWKSLIPGTEIPLMVFRLGRAAAPSARAGRRPLATYLSRESR